MNLKELNVLIESVKDDKELHDFYIKKRKELIATINENIKKDLKKLGITLNQ